MVTKLKTKISVTLLLVAVAILAVGVIGFGLSPIAPLMLVIGLIIVVARCFGVSW